MLRLVAAFGIPIGSDEAYYWTWSLHPAYGYTDHPPLVAWTIWLGRSLGPGVGFVRLPFVALEAIAAVAVGRAATLLADDVRAGAVAAILFALIPQTKLAIGVALPDGPYVAAWALALWGAAALAREPTRRTALGLGLALAAAVLARWFGWALVAGIVGWVLASRRADLRRHLSLALAIVAIAYVPFLVWNASVGWENVAFTFARRQTFGASPVHLVDVSTVRFLVYGGLLAVAVWLVAWRAQRTPLVVWTALPLPIALLGFSFVTTTESYWIVGPAASLCVGAGIALATRRAVRRACYGVFALGTAYATAAALFLVLPEGAQAAVFRGAPALRAPLGSKVYMYPALAADVRRLATGDATVLVDRFETAAQLRWYGIDARIATPIPQQAQWTRWHRDDPLADRAVVVTFQAPLDANSGLAHALDAAYAHVTPGPLLRYTYAGIDEDPYGITFATGPRPGARAALGV